MGFLGDVGLGGVDASANLSEGVYPVFLTGASYIEPKTADKGVALVFNYRVVDGVTGAGKQHSEWWNNIRNLSDAAKPFFKRRLLQFGIPEDVINNDGTTEDMFVGVPLWLRLYRNGQGYIAVGEVWIRDKSNTTNPEADPKYVDGVGYGNAIAQAASTFEAAGLPLSPASAPSTGSVTDGL